jgi:hypothetical protein
MARDSRAHELGMSTLALALLAALAVATCTFYIAGGIYGQGSPWAKDVCALSRALCEHPAWSLMATGVVGVLYLLLRAFRF